MQVEELSINGDDSGTAMGSCTMIPKYKTLQMERQAGFVF